MSEFTHVSRRRFLLLAGAIAGTAACTATFAPSARADELPKLTESDATASALGYREDATKVDEAKFPTYKPGQGCANCKFFMGTDKTASAGCELFPGKAVTTKGWCSAYNPKT